MQILIVNSLYDPWSYGGAERSVRLLAEGLAAAGHGVTVVHGHPEEREKVEDKGGVRVHGLPLANIYWPYDREQAAGGVAKTVWHTFDSWNPWMADKVARIAARETPHLIHTHNLTGFSAAVWSRLGPYYPVIHTIRDYYALCPRTTRFRDGQVCQSRCLDCRFLAAPRVRASRHVKGLVGISRSILDEHGRAGAFPAAEAEVIPNPVEWDGETVPTRRRSPNEPVRFGYLGRLHETKGIGWLLETMTGAVQGDNWQIWIAGKGPSEYEDSLKETYIDPRIQFCGYMDSREVFAAIDALIVPSLFEEPFGRVVAEAFVAGRPVIASDRGALAELVDEGKNGFICPAGDVRKLAEVIDRILEAPQTVLGSIQPEPNEGRRFSCQKITERYIDFYERFAVSRLAKKTD